MIFLKTRSQEKIDKYLLYLKSVGSFSNLYSSSSKPYVQYRVAENTFCKAFEAENLARADAAYDALIDGFGIGIKTFILAGNSKIEKIAEFNSFSAELRGLSGLDLARRLAHYRNLRITTADRTYSVDKRVYHIIGRDAYKIKIFEVGYDLIDLESIEIIAENRSSLKFRDNLNEYNFNFSKSVLMKRFNVPSDALEIEISIIPDPISVLFRLFGEENEVGSDFLDIKNAVSEEISLSTSEIEEQIPGVDYVVLPLYSPQAKLKNCEPIVPLKSQLNQWNAGGRERDPGEVYISIPIKLHHEFPNFFPGRDLPFNLRIPSGEVLSAKVCQENSKALMTNPNNAMSNWLLRRVLGLETGELLQYNRLVEVGFDSVKITKIDHSNFLIDLAHLDSYEEFIN
jgi:hypothetical protein